MEQREYYPKTYPSSAATYRPHSSTQSFFINQPVPAGYSVPPTSNAGEQLGIPQHRFQNYREMREAIMIEIEKENLRNREIKSEINWLERELVLPGSEYRLIGTSISSPVPRLFAPPLSNYGSLTGDSIASQLLVPWRDGGMSVEEKLARNCEEKRLVEKAIAARHQRYGV
ncbi:hypothetical protein FXO38_02583 [Capsicum annuum]|nr:hypothetical protein FXO38_02583 [Capsicum annuum]